MKIENFVNRFHRNYTVSETGCWLWQKSCNPQGYPSLKLIKDGRAWYNNQVPYILFNGPIPKGMVVRHRCDTPACVNPSHLVLGTPADNVADMVDRKRSLNCGKSGVTESVKPRRSDIDFKPRDGEKNNQAKLDWDTVRKIRADTGQTLHQLKAKYGISVTQCHRIRNNLNWIE